MKLLTKKLLKQFATTGSQEWSDDPVVISKYFLPWTDWTWYATEYNPQEEMFFWLVDWLEKERGYFSLLDLKTAKNQFWLPVERDLWFDARPVSAFTSLS